MRAKRLPPPRPQQLRDDAEAQLTRATVQTPARPADELLYELQVHRIELEMQNEALRQSQAALQESRDRYADLYECAPVGYLTLSAAGLIVTTNLTGATLLGLERRTLQRRRFDTCVGPEDREHWQRLFADLMQREDKAGFELALRRGDTDVFPAWLDCRRVTDSDGRPLLRLTLTDISARKRAAHMVDLQEDARRRLSGELHARTSPNLAAIKINLGILATLPVEHAVERAKRLDDIHALIADTDASIREISSDLRPPLLDYAGLPAALQGYARQFAKRTGMAVGIDCVPTEARLTPVIESLLFRIFQEALTNCAKHARAKSVAIALHCDGRIVTLTIEDDGIGFNSSRPGKTAHVGGLGLLGMREMAAFAGGDCVITTFPGKGTRIEVKV